MGTRIESTSSPGSPSAGGLYPRRCARSGVPRTARNPGARNPQPALGRTWRPCPRPTHGSRGISRGCCRWIPGRRPRTTTPDVRKTHRAPKDVRDGAIAEVARAGIPGSPVGFLYVFVIFQNVRRDSHFTARHHAGRMRPSAMQRRSEMGARCPRPLPSWREPCVSRGSSCTSTTTGRIRSHTRRHRDFSSWHSVEDFAKGTYSGFRNPVTIMLTEKTETIIRASVETARNVPRTIEVELVGIALQDSPSWPTPASPPTRPPPTPPEARPPSLPN